MEVLKRVPTIIILLAVLFVGITIGMMLDIPLIKTATIVHQSFNVSTTVVSNVLSGMYILMVAFISTILILIVVIIVLAVRGKD